MNIKAFNADRSYLFSVIDHSSISPKEATYRKNEINQAFVEMEKKNCIDARYYQHAHEIKSIPFLSQFNKFGKIKIADNSAHRSGCDFELDASKHYYIECVCASAGDKKNGLDRFCGFDKMIDYNAKKAIINSRFTSVLQAKVSFYQSHAKISIFTDKPYIIFLSAGELAYEYLTEEYGFALTDILLGRGSPQITINAETNEVIKQDYSHNDVFRKWNGKDIGCNLFCDPSFTCVSAILFTTAVLTECYSPSNTWLFSNPYAKIPIVKKDFHRLVYWSGKPEEMYCARKNGHKVIFRK